MRILVLNECYSNNIGDQAIAEAFVISLSNLGNNVTVKDFSFRGQLENSVAADRRWGRMRKAVPRPIKRLHFLLRNIAFAVRESKKEYDCAVIGGGQLILGDSNFPWAMLLWVTAMKFFGKRVYVLGVGAGEKFSTLEYYAYSLALRQTTKVILRDQNSIETVRKIFRVEASFCPDLVYSGMATPTEVTARQKQCIVCIGAHSVHLRYADETTGVPLSLQQYLADWKRIVRTYLAEGYRVVLMATTQEDLEQSRELFCCLGDHDNVELLSVVPTHREFYRAALRAEVLVSARMHALILGHIAGARIIPYFISKKITSFSSEYLSRAPSEIATEITRFMRKEFSPSLYRD